MVRFSGTFSPGDEDGEKLFKELPYESGPTHEECGVCGSELSDPIAKLQLGKKAHVSCVHDAVETGLLDAYSVRAVERENGLHEFSLVKDHPSANRCVVCGGTWGREEQLGDTLAVYTARPSAAFAHKVCVANAIYRRELSAQKISEIAHDSKLTMADLFPRSLQRCVYCSNPVSDDGLLTHSGALAHSACIKHLYQSGQLNEIQAADVASMNFVSREMLGDSPRIKFDKRAQLGAVIAEAQGLIAQLWNSFVGGIRSLISSFQSTSDSYDSAIAQAEGLLRVVSGKPATGAVLEDVFIKWAGSDEGHDILEVSSIKSKKLDFIKVSELLSRAVGVRPSKIVASYIKDASDCREVMVPRTASRVLMMQKLGVDPQMERAMEMLAALQVADDQHAEALAEIKLKFGVMNMDRDSKAAQQVVLDHLSTLETKQTKFRGMTFKIIEAVRRTSTSYPPVIEGIFALVLKDKELTTKIGLLLRQFTTASYTYDKVKAVVKEIPSAVREQLSEIEIPVGGPEQPSSKAPAFDTSKSPIIRPKSLLQSTAEDTTVAATVELHGTKAADIDAKALITGNMAADLQTFAPGWRLSVNEGTINFYSPEGS